MWKKRNRKSTRSAPSRIARYKKALLRRSLFESLEQRHLLTTEVVPNWTQTTNFSPFENESINVAFPFAASLQAEGEGSYGGFAPEITVRSPSQQNIPDNTGTASFGNTLVGGNLTATFTVINDGSGWLQLDPQSLSVPNGFSIVQGFGATNLSPFGGYTQFTIGFNAPVAGTFTGPLSFTNNDPDESVFNFIISAVATAPNLYPPTTIGIPNIQVSENSQDQIIYLPNYFSDADIPAGDSLVYSIVSQSNPALLTPTIEGENLRIDFQPSQYGTSSLSIRATDEAGQQVTSTFNIVVLPTNDLPLI